MPSLGCLRLSRTLPNLPLVEEDTESVDSTGGGAPLYPPAPPPSSPNDTYRELEELGIPIPRRHNHGHSRASVSSSTTLVVTNNRSVSSPIRNLSDNTDAFGLRQEDRNDNQRDHFADEMDSPLDPTTASFEPTGARFVQPPNRFDGGATQLNYNQQNADGSPMSIAQNGDGSNDMQMQMQMPQQQQQFAGNANFVVAQQPQAMHTFPIVQSSTANMHHQQNQQLMPTFPQAPVYQAQHTFEPLAAPNQNGGYIVQPQGLTKQQQQQTSMQTPRGHGEGSTGRFTPGTYRFTPQGSQVSPEATRSPASTMTGYPPSTEPRSFAPRTSGLGPREPPPRFALQIAPAPAQQTPAASSQGHAPIQTQALVQAHVHQDNGGVGRSQQQHGALQHTFPTSQVVATTSDNNDRGFDPFRTVELSSVIQPIEPISNALVAQAHTVPEYVRNQRSRQLNELTAGPNALPTIEVALHPDYFPFVEGPRNAQPCPNWGVVKIKNIPFAARRAEIIAFLGRNSRVLNDRQEPVHIIMERVTSKTNDCYVEFMTMQDAVQAVEKHNKIVSSGRQNRLGDRPVELELSSQAALMKDLFPHAHGVRWEGSRPVILEDHPTEPWSCFKGFITDEEMICLVKHVEVPQRSPFSRDCPQRPYECMISTLRKLPWYMAEHITIRQRYAVYKAVIALITRLKADLRARKFEENLTEQLYKRLWTSALLCDGLSVVQKDDVAFLVGLSEETMRDFNLPRQANLWSHQWTMAPKPGAPLDVIEWYIAIIREETERTLSMSLPNVQAAIRNDNKGAVLYWGWLFKELDLPRGPPFDNMTLAEMATREFTVVTEILRRAFAQ